MKTDILSYKSKVHSFFGGGLFLVLAISVAMNLSSGHTVLTAVLGAFSQIRPADSCMHFAFWYWLVRGQQSTFRSSFTSLNLHDSKT